MNEFELLLNEIIKDIKSEAKLQKSYTILKDLDLMDD